MLAIDLSNAAVQLIIHIAGGRKHKLLIYINDHVKLITMCNRETRMIYSRIKIQPTKKNEKKESSLL